MSSIRLWLLLLAALSVECRHVSVGERQTRASFVQRILQRHRKREGDIRLAGGGTQYEGNVYVWHAGRWGAVCDDSWDETDAGVVCRKFNRTGRPTTSGHFGSATGKYWMDDVVCEGTEFGLNHCQFSGWGVTDCYPGEVAGVICDEADLKKVVKEPLVLAKRPIHEALPTDLRLRLAGGRDHNEGRVEIFLSGEWSSVCPDGWSMYEALTVCRHLGLGYALDAVQSDFFQSSKVVLGGVQCQGNESSLALCTHERIGEVSCPGRKGHVAGVACTRAMADLSVDYAELERTAHLQDVPLYQLQCAMEEYCLTESAYEVKKSNPNWQWETRRLLRFTASAANVGTDDFRPAIPKHLWQWHLCHMHYHSMEVFAMFDVLDSGGRRVAQGHKASFCLEDNTCLPGVDKKYSCHNYGDQGISVNCTDIYRYNIDCQWVDISDIEPGTYQLRVAVNPHAKVPEQTYHNNAALCTLYYGETHARVYGCRLQRP